MTRRLCPLILSELFGADNRRCFADSMKVATTTSLVQTSQESVGQGIGAAAISAGPRWRGLETLATSAGLVCTHTHASWLQRQLLHRTSTQADAIASQSALLGMVAELPQPKPQRLLNLVGQKVASRPSMFGASRPRSRRSCSASGISLPRRTGEARAALAWAAEHPRPILLVDPVDEAALDSLLLTVFAEQFSE